jgi:CheY-like chemotaxis protein
VNQELAQAMLLHIGCTVDVVGNGRQAVEALTATAYDAVLMDCQMPEMDGFQATALIRSGGAGVARSHVPIIALTANALQGDRERCLEAGMNDYVPKPLSRRELFAALSRCLEASGGAVAAAEAAAEATALTGASAGSRGAATPAAAPASTPLRRLNPQALDQIRELDPQGGAALLARVGKLYLESAPRLGATLGLAAARADARAVASAAHSLKSSSANIGAQVLAELCKRAEEGAGAGEILPETIAAIDRELETALAMVQAELCVEREAV